MKGLVSVLVLTLAVYWGQCQGAHPTRTRQGLRPSSLASNLKLLEPALRALAGSDPKPARKPQPEQRGPVKSPAYTAIGGLPVSPGRELHLKSRPPTRTKKGRRPPHGKAGPPALMSGAGRRTAGRQRFTAKSQPEQPAIVPTYRMITSKAAHAEQESTEDVHVAPGVSASGVRQSFVQNRNVLVSHDEFTTNLAVTRQRTRQKRGMDRRYIKRHFTEMRVRPNANKDNITTIISVKADNAAMKRDSPVKGKPGTNNVTNVNENPNDKVVSAGYTYLPKPIITDMKPDRRIPTNIRNRGRFSDIPTGMQPQRHRSAFSRTQDMNNQKEFNHIRHDNTGTHKTAHNPHSATQRKGLSTSYIMKELLSRLSSKPYIEHSTVNNVSGEATAHNPMNQRSLSRYPPQFTPTKSQSKSTKLTFPSLYQSSVQTIPEPAPVIADSTRDQRLTLGSRLDRGQHDSSISTPNNKAIDSVQMRTGNKSSRTEKNRNTKKRRVGSRPNVSATAHNTRATKFHNNSRRTWRYHVPHVRYIKQEPVGYEYAGNSSPNNAVSYTPNTSGKPNGKMNKPMFSDIQSGMQPQRHRSAFSRKQDMNNKNEFNHIRHDSTGTHKTAHNSHSATQIKGPSTSYIMKEILSRLSSKPYVEHSKVNTVIGEATAHNPMNQRSLSRYPPQFTPAKSQSKSTKRTFPSLYQSSVQTNPEPAPVVADSTRDQRLTLGSRLDIGQHDSSISTPNNKAIDSVQMRTGNKILRTGKNRNTIKRRVVYRPNVSATAHNTRATKFQNNSRRTWRYHVPHVRDIKQEPVGYEYTGNSSPNNAVSYSTSGKPNGKRNKPTFNGPSAIIKHKQLQGIVYPKITKPVQSLAVKLPVRSLATGDQLANNPNFMKSIQAYFLRNQAIRRTNNNAGNGMPADNRTRTTIMSSFPTEIGRNKSNGYKPITSAKANVAQSTRVVTDGPPTKYSVTTQDNAFARKANQTVELRSSSRSRKVTLANDKATYEELKSVVNAVRILQRYMNSETTSSILGMLSGKTTRSKKGADCKLCNILKLLVGLNCQMSVVS